VNAFFRQIFIHLIHLGALGPLVLGILDSSFLFAPFGNDFLVVVLASRDPQDLPLYVLAAGVGSTIGVLILDVACRKEGQAGLRRMMSRKRFVYLEAKMIKHSALALIIACLAPPPFPFTIVVRQPAPFNMRGRVY
jgi:hypothetical protein